MLSHLSRALTVIVGAVFSVALYSCKGTAPVPSKMDLLTAHPWFLVGLTETSSLATVDRFAAMPNCVKDNTLLFKTNQTFTFNPGIISCNAEGPRDIAWSFTTNETRLLLAELPDITYGQIDVEIVALTTTTLQLRYTVTAANARSETVYTYADKGSFTPPAATQQTVFDRLTAHKWRMSSYMVYGNTSGSGGSWVWTDLYAPMSACRRDDFLQFNPDYTLVNDEGSSRCAPADPQSKATRWGLTETGGLSILATGVLGIGNYSSAQVTDTELTLRYSYTNQGNGSSTTVVYTAF